MYAKISKHLIRDNANNLLILFKQDDIKRIQQSRIDMFYENFSDLCHKCWQQMYGFLVIDKDTAFIDENTKKDLTTLYRDIISWHRYVDMDSIKERERIAKEIAKMSEIQFAKNTMLWRLVKWERTLHWRDTLNLLSIRWNRLSKILLIPPRILSWLKYFLFGRRRGIKTPKNNDWVLRTILYRFPRLWNQCWIVLKTVPSIMNEMSEIIQPRDLLYDHAPSIKKFSMLPINRSSIRHLLQTSEGQEKLQANYIIRWNKNIWKRSWAIRKPST